MSGRRDLDEAQRLMANNCQPLTSFLFLEIVTRMLVQNLAHLAFSPLLIGKCCLLTAASSSLVKLSCKTLTNSAFPPQQPERAVLFVESEF